MKQNKRMNSKRVKKSDERFSLSNTHTHGIYLVLATEASVQGGEDGRERPLRHCFKRLSQHYRPCVKRCS